MESTISESQAKLMGRWGINHDPYSSIGFVPAPGLISRLRQILAKCLWIVGSIGVRTVADKQ
jgi:hypothetical protein